MGYDESFVSRFLESLLTLTLSSGVPGRGELLFEYYSLILQLS